jgi:hypothetical protein
MPVGPALRLPVPPRLASWNRAGDPDQVRLAGYLDAAEVTLRLDLTLTFLRKKREETKRLARIAPVDLGIPGVGSWNGS